jgi:hypothetical protein
MHCTSFFFRDFSFICHPTIPICSLHFPHFSSIESLWSFSRSDIEEHMVMHGLATSLVKSYCALRKMWLSFDTTTIIQIWGDQQLLLASKCHWKVEKKAQVVHHCPLWLLTIASCGVDISIVLIEALYNDEVCGEFWHEPNIPVFDFIMTLHIYLWIVLLDAKFIWLLWMIFELF